MMKSKWVVVLVLVALLGTVGCSDDANPSELLVIEAQVEQLLGIMAVVLVAVDPFSASPSVALDAVQGVDCTPSDVELCMTSGTLTTDCPEGEVDFDMCADEFQETSLVIHGMLDYDPADTWPTGSRTVDVLSSSFGNTKYVITLDGTSSVAIAVTDLDGGPGADCDGDLDTGQAVCTLN